MAKRRTLTRERPEARLSDFKDILDEFEQAVRRDEMKGAAHPFQRGIAERSYHAAKSALVDLVEAISTESWQLVDR